MTTHGQPGDIYICENKTTLYEFKGNVESVDTAILIIDKERRRVAVNQYLRSNKRVWLICRVGAENKMKMLPKNSQTLAEGLLPGKVPITMVLLKAKDKYEQHINK